MLYLVSALLLLGGDEPVETMAKRMLPIYAKDATEYAITVESAPTNELELKKEPIFEWSNPARNTQHGAVYLWLRHGRPAALINVFSGAQPQEGRRIIRHELHALDTEKLMVKRDALNQWQPQAGLDRKVLPDAGAPAAALGARLVQMRRLAQELTGYSIDREGKRWELRLLPTPLYRYAPGKTGVIDGALFAFVSSAGTDPEVLLVIEAKEADGKLRWEFACGRFSDWELHVQRKNKEVYTSVPNPTTNPYAHDPLHLYRIYPEKIVSLEGKLLARVRQTPTGPQTIPVDDK